MGLEREGYHIIDGKVYRLTRFDQVFTVFLNPNPLSIYPLAERTLPHGGPSAKKVRRRASHYSFASSGEVRVWLREKKEKNA